MAVTVAEIKAWDFEYLTGDDLIKYCPIPILQKQFLIDDTCIESAVSTAYSEVTDQISANYDILAELDKTGEDRSKTIVKIMALSAVRNICANLGGVTQNMDNNFTWLDKMILSIKRADNALTKVSKKDDTINSGAYVVDNEFNTLG